MTEALEKSIELLEFKIDPYQSVVISKIVGISFTDEGIDKSWATHISNGVAELKEYKPGGEENANL